MLTEKQVLNEIKSVLWKHGVDFLPGENIMIMETGAIIGSIFVDIEEGNITILYRIAAQGGGREKKLNLADPTCFDQLTKIATGLYRKT